MRKCSAGDPAISEKSVSDPDRVTLLIVKYDMASRGGYPSRISVQPSHSDFQGMLCERKEDAEVCRARLNAARLLKEQCQRGSCSSWKAECWRKPRTKVIAEPVEPTLQREAS